MLDTAYVYKMVIVGNAGVGKTSTVHRWSTNSFREQYQVTVGVQHFTKDVEFETKDSIVNAKLILWDMGGQDTFKMIRPIFYKSAKAVVLVFDMNNRASFDTLTDWVNEADSSIGKRVPYVLCGNKCDLPHEVCEEEARDFASEIDAPFIMTSAKDGTNIADIFKTTAEQVYRDAESEIVQPTYVQASAPRFFG